MPGGRGSQRRRVTNVTRENEDAQHMKRSPRSRNAQAERRFPYLRNLQGESIRCDTRSDGKASNTEYGIFLTRKLYIAPKKKKRNK